MPAGALTFVLLNINEEIFHLLHEFLFQLNVKDTVMTDIVGFLSRDSAHFLAFFSEKFWPIPGFFFCELLKITYHKCIKTRTIIDVN